MENCSSEREMNMKNASIDEVGAGLLLLEEESEVCLN